MFGLEREWLEGEFGGGFRKKRFFLNATLNFQKLKNERRVLLSGLWVDSSFMNKTSSSEFYGIAEGVPGSECTADGTPANI